ncbi:LexA family protein [Andreprevotia chitinilytica]|uniref:LexA family protein n=1 Tax=Andreprevotia chitinilytica TaxID=396808 RepID=UPI00068B7BE1|nr:LexA family transcriptional regulator [Andreprevotia chitinilytica]
MKNANVSQSELARAVGIKQQSIQYLCDLSKHARGSKYTTEIARHLQVSPEWLSNGGGHSTQEPAATYNVVLASDGESSLLIRNPVPLIAWAQVMEWCKSAVPVSGIEVEEWLSCPEQVGARAFALRVRGGSMGPRYLDGDTIFVDPDEVPAHESMVIAWRAGDFTFKQLQRDENGACYLTPLNPDWPGPKFQVLEDDDVICGVVVGNWMKA